MCSKFFIHEHSLVTLQDSIVSTRSKSKGKFESVNHGTREGLEAWKLPATPLAELMNVLK
jgi:hypothetical protein